MAEFQAQITRSASVERALSSLPERQPVYASEIVRALFRLHSEYAGHKAASASLHDTGSKHRPEEWIAEVETLYDVRRMRELLDRDNPFAIGGPVGRIESNAPNLSSSVTPAENGMLKLNGRLVIIGLSLLEQNLYQQLQSLEIFDALRSELKYPLVNILTSRGRELYERATSNENVSSVPEESVPSLSDNPLTKGDEDLLGRKPFAKFLARRILAISDQENGAYSIHIKGQWGSGKSSLLNFIKIELKGTGDWYVAEFNAWRNQQIRPPWWALIEKVFRDVEVHLGPNHRLAEYWWRFNTGRLHYILGFVTLLWLFVLFGLPFLTKDPSQTDILRSTASAAENISKIVALIATVWGGLIAINRSFLLSSARAAQNYTELVNNPTEEIKSRFEKLIQRLKPKKVAILIDDLDRCQSEYVVELLEGIQTLYREAPVVFIVAADEKWLNACYEQVYEKLSKRVGEPGKMLGSLFLEKAFRFSTPMPGIPQELRKKFWQHLLAMKRADENNDLEVQKIAQEQVKSARSEQELGNLVNSNQNRSFAEQRAIREAAVVRLAANEVQERLEHTLAPYFKLLEPNPRSMKRFVNSFSANRALAILSEVDIELHQLALWTILSSRWPSWADYFMKNPEVFEKVQKKDISNLDEDIAHLLEVSELQAIINGVIDDQKPGYPLKKDILIKTAQFQA